MSTILKKYHGIGNDYIVIDPNRNTLELNKENIKQICDRNFGVGSDGILYGPILEGGKIKLRIFNPDGSEAEKSGNGVRIFSKYLFDEKYVTGKKFVLNTLGGDVTVEYMDNKAQFIKVAMGKVTFKSNEIEVKGEVREVVNENMVFKNRIYKSTCVSIGNPHCVIPMVEVSKEIVNEIGPFVVNSDYFLNRINLQILKVIDRNNIQIEIYERGAGYTLSSGSSSCAAASAAFKLGLVDRDITVHMPGGKLKINIMEDGMVFMTGEVKSIGTVILSEEFIKEIA